MGVTLKESSCGTLSCVELLGEVESLAYQLDYYIKKETGMTFDMKEYELGESWLNITSVKQEEKKAVEVVVGREYAAVASTYANCYVQCNDGHRALQLYEQFHRNLTQPDLVAFVCTLKACTSLADLDYGQHIHSDIIDSGLEGNVVIGSSVIDLYIKGYSQQEHYEKVLQFLDQLQREGLSPDSVTFNSILKAYTSTGSVEDCRRAHMDIMECEGFRPDGIAFLCLLSACSHHPDLVERGCLHFKSMVDEYHLEPSVEHYNTLIDIFGHANCLNQAEDLIETIPFQKNSTGWTSLLNASKNRGHVNLGKRCFNQLMRMDPKNTASYVLMAGLYAQAGMLEDARKLEEMRRRTNGWKKPAKAFIEIDREVHGFVVGDQAHPKKCSCG
ncbi:hypothetical protein GOP47_0008558 [Adiantum capillus-veneris]|uniref:Pentatricopeptide repeat-containing protein n=1 Tax=Adiantum capillus-veneris TaxID=13818 RepID=A0A9D4ZI65_ADICA|nr:hypothetical protein GOP47_0008558 [Adiantum capillus-veneris]